MKHSLWLAVLTLSLVAGACSSSSENKKEDIKLEEDSSPLKDVNVSKLRLSMQKHLGITGGIVDAIAVGDTTQVNTLADALSSEKVVGDAPESWASLMAPVEGAKPKIKGASDLDSAAGAIAGMGVGCGTCHVSLDAVPHIQLEPLPDGVEDKTQVHMKRHAWAVARMWEGMVYPSDDLWTQGAALLASEPLYGTDMRDKIPEGASIDEETKTLHEMAQKATSANPEDRSAVFADVLRSCSSCHQKLAK